jgi:hypothetical protein
MMIISVLHTEALLSDLGRFRRTIEVASANLRSSIEWWG